MGAILGGRGRRGAPGLWRDRRGATLMEFGLVVVPLVALLLATLEVAITFLAEAALQTVTDRTARMITTGEAQTSAKTAATFKAAACAKLPSMFKCDNLLVDVRAASTFAAVDTSKPTVTLGSDGKPSNSFSYNIGAANQIVVVRLMYIWPMPVGPMGWDLGDVGRGQHLLVTTNVAKNEPYKT